MLQFLKYRRYAMVSEWMEQLFEAKTGGESSALNCGELQLSLADIYALEQAIKGNTLPESEGGFFFGHQFQDESVEEYRDQDLRFCAWAREQLEAGQAVYYSCWW